MYSYTVGFLMTRYHMRISRMMKSSSSPDVSVMGFSSSARLKIPPLTVDFDIIAFAFVD